MNKRIALIIERIDITLGGAERSVFELAAALSVLGLKADILAAKGKTNAKNIRILCRNTPGKRTHHSTFAKALRKYLSENDYSLIHSTLPFDFADVYQPRGGSFAESILRNAASYQNKFVESYKKITASANLRRAALLRAEKKLCKNPNGPLIAALSNYVAWQFQKHHGVDDDRIAVIPNGIKINNRIDTHQAEKLHRQILAQLHLKEADEPVFFLFAANNFRLKGLASLTKAMQLASQSNTERPAFLIVVGNDKTRKHRRLAEKLGIHKKILFLGPVKNIQNVLSITDVAALPTFYDPSSRFILEAIAANKPVITTEFNGATDLFVKDRHGKVIDSPENITALAQAVAFFSDTNNIQKASQAITEDNLKEKISISRAAEKLIFLYESALKNRGQ